MRSSIDAGALVAGLPDPVLVVDERFRLRFGNPAFERHHGDSGDSVGAPLGQLVHADDRAELEAALRGVYRTGSPDRVVVRVRFADGAFRHVEVAIGALADGAAGHVALQLREVGSSDGAHAVAARLERELVQQARVQELLTSIAATYLELPSEAFDEAVHSSLAELGDFVGADRSYVFSYDFEGGTTSNSHEWCAAGIEPQIDELQQIPLELVPRWVAEHRAGRIMRIADVAALRADSNTRKLLEPQGVRSLLAVPIMDGERCHGFVGFDAVRQRRPFGLSEQRVLGVFTKMLASVRKRIAAERALEQQRAFLAGLIEHSGAAISVKGLDGRYLDVNPRWSQVTGVSRADAVGASDHALFPAHVAQALVASDRRVLERDGVLDVEEALSLGDQERWLLSTKFLVRDHDGTVSSLCSMSTDITDRKRSEDALRDAEARTRTVLGSVAAGVVVVEREHGLVVFVNRRFSELTGHDADALLGRDPTELHVHGVEPEVMRRLRRMLAGELDSVRPVALERADGSRIDVEMRATRGELDGRACVFVVYADVSRQVHVERQERWRTRILAEMVGGAPLASVLEAIVGFVEGERSEARCAVMLADDHRQRLRVEVAPRVPTALRQALDDLAISSDSGPCGACVHGNRAVIVDDIEAAPEWGAIAPIVRAVGLRACWSLPLRATTGAVLGSFTVYLPEAAAPSLDDLQQAEHAAALASLAVEQARATRERHAREAAEAAQRLEHGALATLTRSARAPVQGVLRGGEALRHDQSLAAEQRERAAAIVRSAEELDALLRAASLSRGVAG